MKRLLPLFALLFFGLAFAQVTDIGSELETRYGLPAGLFSTVIGLLSAWLIIPLTALAKKLGRTTGPTTVTVSAFFSALLVGVGGWVLGLYGTGTASYGAACWAALLAFLKANGDYLTKVQAQAAALKAVTGQPARLLNPAEPVTNPAYQEGRRAP